MKRQKLMHHLQQHGCRKVREGGHHTIMKNPANNRQAPVPRHREVLPGLVRKICQQLGVPLPSER